MRIVLGILQTTDARLMLCGRFCDWVIWYATIILRDVHNLKGKVKCSGNYRGNVVT